MGFKPASRTGAKLRLALVGPSGSGKTWTALAIAHGMGGQIGLIDTENSAELYAHLFKFDVNHMRGEYSPVSYAKHIALAAKHDYPVLVVDSLSHAWSGPGGALELKDQNKKGNNDWSGWAAVTPLHNRLLSSIRDYPGHIICTMRTRTEWVIEGRKPIAVGTKPVQRDGIEFEFGVVFELDATHKLTVRKTRFPELDGLEIQNPNDKLGERLLDALAAPSEPEKERPVFDANKDRARKRLHAVASEVAERIGYKDQAAFSAQVRILAKKRAGVPIEEGTFHKIPAEQVDKLAAWLGTVPDIQTYQDMYTRIMGAA